MIYVIKKDGTREEFNSQKIVAAVNKSAARILYTFSDKEKEFICQFAEEHAEALGKNEIEIQEMHNIVEGALERVNPAVAKSYRDYRNYKLDFIHMMDDVYTKSQAIRYIGDKSNANTDSALVATKRSLIFNELNKELYRKFFMNRNELQACKDGYIYIHDQSARLDTMNCCLFDVASVLSGGFEMGNVWYNEPKTLDTAFDVMGDIILSTAAQQYGGFTVPEVDKILAPYAQKSYDKYIQEFMKYSDESWTGREERAIEYALDKVRRDFDQGWQGIEYKLNTVGSSRGDYPFVTVTLGLGIKQFEKMASISLLEVHKGGQGKAGRKKPVLFPKIVFLYDENIHGKGKISEDVFEAGVDCSAKTMYPDWLSMSGKGYISSMYKQYGKVISPMGCRAFLSPWYERGGMYPADDKDVPVFVGRFNIGAVSLHLPGAVDAMYLDGRGVSFKQRLIAGIDKDDRLMLALHQVAAVHISLQPDRLRAIERASIDEPLPHERHGMGAQIDEHNQIQDPADPDRRMNPGEESTQMEAPLPEDESRGMPERAHEQVYAIQCRLPVKDHHEGRCFDEHCAEPSAFQKDK